MKNLVEVIAKALVENPDEVVVTETEKERVIVVELRVAPSDMGKVIGKSGRIAKGAGVDISEVNRLVKQFEQSRKLMKQMPGMMGGKRGKRGMFGKLPF